MEQEFMSKELTVHRGRLVEKDKLPSILKKERKKRRKKMIKEVKYHLNRATEIMNELD